ncbi:helix-turn-helix domain-containing protein [Sporosarcina sp. P16b]|uniref:helix-turn-helix domain-containing protein n=1 Tax=Sporosarcina sp. P16b TaxID=2048261 RepID=UPI001E413342|nr:helix-turn-helix domain-containing protein [Sporosarcina sp. P16b]
MTSKLNIEPIKRSTLTAQETATYLGVSLDMIYKLAREKSIPNIRLGQRLLFKKDSLDRWMSEIEQ